MSGTCLEKLGHKDCGTRQGLQVYAQEDGSVDGYCWNCLTYIANPYGTEKKVGDLDLPPPKTEEEIKTEVAEISGYQCVDLRARKLRAKNLDEFNIKIAVSEKDGRTPIISYFPYTKDGGVTGYKAKSLVGEKKSWSVGDCKQADLFNWENARKSGAYRLIITEGEEDAVAVHRIYEMYGNPDYEPAIVSLPRGASSAKQAISKHLDEINRIFREVVLCFDDDTPGQRAIEAALLLLPNAKTVKLPCKDANDCILEGHAKAAYKAFAFDAAKPKNSRIVWGRDLHEAAREPTPRGELTWPWAKLDDMLRGIRYGETIYIGAGVKMGKSELLNALASHFIEQHKVKVFMAKPEEANKKTYKLMAGKIAGKNFTDPDIEFDYKAFDKAAEHLQDNLAMVDLYQHLGWASLKSDITQAAASGVKVVFIDPITNLTNGINAAEANTKLQEIAQECAAMSLDLNIVIFLFCHLKAPEGNIQKESRLKKYEKGDFVGLGNCPHEMGGDVLSSQFSGSRAMMRSCNLMLGLEGNKDDDLPEEYRNIRYLKILEDREFGNSGKQGLFWNRSTTLFKEI